MSYTPLFADRIHAGEELAQVIHDLLTQQTIDSGVKPIPIVYALPRGGIPVAAPIARLLGCPLTIVVAKKISHPENPELAIGAVTSSGNILWTEQKLFSSKHDARWREAALTKAIKQAQSLEEQLISACPQVNIKDATAILVDDGIATGMTMAVACSAIKALSPRAIWLCTPLAPQKLLPWLNQWGDRIIVLKTPEPFWSVSNFYAQFPQVNTLEALRYLQQQQQ
ncbi:phosphoribosyltransferase [Nostoc linckia z18]|jgi:putative phosphoribosyl transferase|uniref:Phosphoribosyltransferase n=2 Tax=Nostoc linckia TaxID=92942 RepID=A0A9Q5ZBY4_NOSLI|nr:phosphoribosyltransferase family protein [Nostoc linckia]PHK41589.1 phosphoribosyltransferase [Nostoc linckia z15]PHK46058.1 phosphoribosyltransferase [Nostoc linckia z16]PHJ68259.1 phosphoribosyltransferase [Nostoc linckia z1]PHJ73696.1 phosphoribosyltransferase [Nostoc linckia z3]PHJ78264.1 phosphoribosyltransferase [Nostoc linckia z2]